MFITIEGIDESGKTTQVELLSSFLQEKHPKQEIVSTREPGGTLTAEKIRDILFDIQLNDHLTELFLYIAARREHVLRKIKPALDQGKIVICDRFLHSTIAYQGYGFGIDVNLIRQLHEIILPKKYLPSLTFILDVDVEISIIRAKQALDAKYEDILGKEFFNKVRKGFIELSQENNCYLIDANNSASNVHDNITKIIHKYL